MDYYGLQCYNKQGKAMGFLYTYNSDKDVSYVSENANSRFMIKGVKRWKTRNGATKNLPKYNRMWCKWGDGFLSVERLPDRWYRYFS